MMRSMSPMFSAQVKMPEQPNRQLTKVSSEFNSEIQFSGKANSSKKTRTLGILTGVAAALGLTACVPAEPAVTPETAPVIFTQHGEPSEIVAMIDDGDNYLKLYGNHPDKILTSTEVLGELQYNERTEEYHALEADRDTESGGSTWYYDSYKLEEFAKGKPNGMIVLPKVQDCGLGGELLDGFLGRDTNEYLELEIAQLIPNAVEDDVIFETSENGDYTVYLVDKNGEVMKNRPLFDVHIQDDTVQLYGKPAYLAAMAALIGEADQGWWAEGGVTDFIGDGPFDLDPEDCYNIELWLKSKFGKEVGHVNETPYPFDSPDKTG